MQEPRAEYEARLNRWRTTHAEVSVRFDRIAFARLAIFLAAAVVAWLAFARQSFTGWLFLAPVAAFVALVVWHDRVARVQQRAARAIEHYERGLARLDDRWPGAGNSGERFRDPAHPYAEDLDLFGRGSLFELLCIARTAVGEDTLARWLRGGAGAAPPEGAPLPLAHPLHAGASDEQPAARQVLERQEAVDELRQRLDLREDVALLGEEVRQRVHAARLAAWAAGAPVRFPGYARLAAAVLAWLALATIALWAFDVTEGGPFYAVALMEVFLAWRLRRAVDHVVQAVDRPAQELDILALVLGRIERESLRGTRLSALHAQLGADEKQRASSMIAELGRLVDHREWSENLFFRLPAFVLMWDQRYAMRIEQWRREHGVRVPVWMSVVGEFEALSSLAAFAYERPATRFPEIVAQATSPDARAVRRDNGPGAGVGSPLFEAAALFHPLIPVRDAVPNDLALGGAQARLLIVSGSNMSGKSTLLRAAGLNAVLAFCGSTVCAESLRISPLAIGASIRVVDSLQDHRSRFYSEISRLRQILDIASERPALFLIDEMLNGTNSRDRRIGAEAVLDRLLAAGAIGMVTTHDLALADMAGSLVAPAGRPAANVHFEDQLIDGQMHFDYRLRPGVVQRSNALDLMRHLGLID